MQDETDIWACIAVADYHAPAPPASEVARGGLLRLWGLLKRIFVSPNNQTASEELSWDRPSSELLRSISPEIDWGQVAVAVARAIDNDWFEQREPSRLVQAFVGAPGCHIAGALLELARQRNLRVLTSPAPDLLLDLSASNESALHALDGPTEETLVIPHLEHWYMRHEDGLTLVRELIERLMIERKRVLIGCDSWAWAFLQHAIGIEQMIGGAQTLAPLDAKRLDAWFRARLDLRQREFRQSGNDQPLFPEPPRAESDGETKSQREPSAFLCSLAARSRGNPAVAVALWRECLRTRPDDTDERASGAGDSRSILWAVPPSELASPPLPLDVDRVHRFVLHWVLIHGGLSLATLAKLLSFSSDEIQRRVSVLSRAGFLEEQDDKLRVKLAAYPFVRRDLQSEGFVTDEF